MFTEHVSVGGLTSPCSRRAAARRRCRREPPGPRPAAEGQLVSWGLGILCAWQLVFLVVVAASCSSEPAQARPTDRDISVAVALAVREHCSQWSDPYTIWLRVVGGSVDRDALGDYAPRCRITSEPSPPSGVAAVVTVSGLVVEPDGSLDMDLLIRSRDAEPSGWFITEHRTVRVQWQAGAWASTTWNLISIQPQPS